MKKKITPAPKRKRGRPSKYRTRVKPRLSEIEKETVRGATRQEIARICGISYSTLKEHANQFPALSAALRGGDAAACDIVEAALFRRAVGYSHPAVKIITVSDGNNSGSHVEEIPYTEHYPPDTPAAVFFLSNRAPERYKQRIECSPEDNKPWPVEIVLTREA